MCECRCVFQTIGNGSVRKMKSNIINSVSLTSSSSASNKKYLNGEILFKYVDFVRKLNEVMFGYSGHTNHNFSYANFEMGIKSIYSIVWHSIV